MTENTNELNDNVYLRTEIEVRRLGFNPTT